MFYDVSQGNRPQYNPLSFVYQYIPPQDVNYMAKNQQEALRLISDAVRGENEDRRFYEYLISEAPDEEDKSIIRSIRDDEMKHYRMFREIYYEMTGRQLPPPANEPFNPPQSYQAGIEKALFGELGAVERYRRILAGLQRRKHMNMVFEIITDELKHATKYNFIYTNNGFSK